jgi:hypothetical protein
VSLWDLPHLLSVEEPTVSEADYQAAQALVTRVPDIRENGELCTALLVAFSSRDALLDAQNLAASRVVTM